MGVQLEPLSMMFASKGYKVEDVIAEVRRMQTGWQHSDYRAWLKHYTTGKRPRSLMEEGKPSLGRADGSSDGALPAAIGAWLMPAWLCSSVPWALMHAAQAYVDCGATGLS